MPNVIDILNIKGFQVWTIAPDASALDATRLMIKRKIGALLVMDAGSVIGIITERDLLQRVVAEGRRPAETLVCNVMTSEMCCCRLHTTIEEARGVMKDHRVRHLPVLDFEGKVDGLISIGDLNAFESHSQEQTIYALTTYIHGRT